MAIIDTGLNGVCLKENTLTDGSKVRNVIIGDLDHPGELKTLRIICASRIAADILFAILNEPDVYTVEGF